MEMLHRHCFSTLRYNMPLGMPRETGCIETKRNISAGGLSIDNAHAIKKTLAKAVGLEVNVEKTKYMLLSRHQNAGEQNYISALR
jgi:hypothetical protein